MSTKRSATCAGITPANIPIGMEAIVEPESVAVATSDLKLNDMVEMFVLPAGCVPVGYEIDATDMDTNATPLVTFDLGVVTSNGLNISTAADDGAAVWVSASQLARAGGLLLHSASAAASRVLAAVKPVNYDRVVGVKITAAPATAAVGVFSGRFMYRAA